MSIFPLQVFEADADPERREALTDEEIYARLRPPTSIVVRFGANKLIGEFQYEGDAKPGCGSKLVARTVRGTEIAEMLTTTCTNSGCGKSISRQEMLQYIDNSGGKDFPFHEHGRVLRIATIEDLNRWSEMQARKPEMLRTARDRFAAAGIVAKVVEVEPIFGGETATVYYLSEERIDFRELVKELAAAFHTRIEMRHVGARDEARLVADYERCGQHCCCQNFLKVLKPVSMRSAKTQKATLDPLKISGRCGRLMCCLRYEDATYEDLKSRLPRIKSRVGTSEGPGIVVDGKILVQLVLVRLEHDGRELAVPVEELLDPETCPKPSAVPPTSGGDPLRGMSPGAAARRASRGESSSRDRSGDRASDRAGDRGSRRPGARSDDRGRVEEPPESRLESTAGGPDRSPAAPPAPAPGTSPIEPNAERRGGGGEPSTRESRSARRNRVRRERTRDDAPEGTRTESSEGSAPHSRHAQQDDFRRLAQDLEARGLDRPAGADGEVDSESGADDELPGTLHSTGGDALEGDAPDSAAPGDTPGDTPGDAPRKRRRRRGKRRSRRPNEGGTSPSGESDASSSPGDEPG